MTAFVPQVGRFFVDADGYPSGTNSTPTYQGPKIEDICDTLVNLSAGWAEPWVRSYSVINSTYVQIMLERANGSEKSQIVFHYDSNIGYLPISNRYSYYAFDDRLWVMYKPSTSGANIPNDGSQNPYNNADFCSAANAFRFSICSDYTYYFYNQDWYYTWLAEESSRRVVLISERTPHEIATVAFMGEDVISDPYNYANGNWEGGGIVAHPQPDTYPELFFNWSRRSDSWVPPDGGPHSLQWYKTDGSWESTYLNGFSIRNELLGANASSSPPYAREPIMVHRSFPSAEFPTKYGSVWPDSGGVEPVRGNGLKGLIDPDFVSYVASHSLAEYALLNSGNFIHLYQGLCVGFDPAFGPMP